MQAEQAVVAGARRRDVAGERGPAQLGHQLRRDVGGDGDHAVASHQHQRQPRDVVAAVDREVAPRRGAERLDELAAAAHVRRRVLDADDARNLGEAQDRVVREIGDRATGHVVEQERQVDLFGDRTEVAIEAFLRRLVVIRNDRERAVRAGFLRVRGERDGLGRGVGARSGDDRNAPARFVHRRLDEQAMLLDVDGRRFAGVPTTTMPDVPLAT